MKKRYNKEMSPRATRIALWYFYPILLIGLASWALYFTGLWSLGGFVGFCFYVVAWVSALILVIYDLTIGRRSQK